MGIAHCTLTLCEHHHHFSIAENESKIVDLHLWMGWLSAWLWMIDLFRKMNANLELEMVWVRVSPKKVIVLRLNMVCEGMLCGSVWLYWGCFVLFIVVWSFTPLMFIDTCHYCNFVFINVVHNIVNFLLWFYPTTWCIIPSIITLRIECKLWVVKSMSILLVKHLLFFQRLG